jgi:hypothetical protein
MKSKTTYHFLFVILLSFSLFANSYAQTNHSNITISSGATFNGSFTGTAPNRTFNITGDDAVINVTALVTELLTNNVTISTLRSGANQAGTITISTAITAASTTTTQRTFSLTANGDVVINAAINLKPANVSASNDGRPASNITINAGGNVTANASGAITTTGGNAVVSILNGRKGGIGGNVTVIAGGTINIGAAFNAGGGTSAANLSSADGAAGGFVSLNGATGVLLGSTISTNGSNSITSGNGGAGGAVTIASSAGTVNVAGAITTAGGAGALVGNGGVGGNTSITSTNNNIIISQAINVNGGSGIQNNAGSVILSGGTGINLTAGITSVPGGIGTAGTVTINTNASSITSGGINDGQSAASVINAGDVNFTGSGIINIAGTNSYSGNTTITGVRVRVSSSAASGASTNGAFGNNNALGLATLTITNGGLQFNNATFSRAITVSGNTTLDAYGAARAVTPTIGGSGTITIGANTVASAEGQDLSLGAAISGSISIVKSFSSVLTLPVANSFTGSKTLNAGTLNINNATALGTIAGTLTINGGTINNSTGAAITTSNYVQTWGGDFGFTGTQNLNLGTGTVTMNTNIQITASASTLTVGGIINAPTFDLTKAGGGTLAFGATAKTFHSLTISAGTLTSTSNTLSIAGDFSNSGTYTHNSGTARFNGTTQSITGSSTTAFSTLTILSGSTTTGVAASTAATFNINSGGKYIQTAGTTMPGTTKNFPAGSVYEVQAVGVTFSGSTYGTLILNYPSGNMSAGGNLTTVLNDLYVKNTGTGSFRLAAGTSPTVTISGNLVIDAGTLNFSTGAGTPSVTVNGDVLLNGGTLQPMTSSGVPLFFVKGNWVNNGATFNPGTTTVNFNSTTAPQNISGSATHIFYNLTNNNTDFSGLSLDANITVTNTLSLLSASNGIFSTGLNTVFVSNPAVAAVVHTGPGYVIGNLKRSIATTGGTFEFPIGSFLGYTPVSLSFNNGNTAGNVNVTTEDGVSANYPNTLSSTKQLARTWTITNGGGGSFTADGVFTFLAGDLLNGATDAALKGYKFDAPSTYGYSANTSNASNTFSFNGISSFSEFGAGECSGDLAVNSGTVTNVTCNSGSDGAITTIVTGNTTAVTYSWDTNPVQTTADISGVPAGFYTVTVTEATTCVASNTFSITEPAAVPAPVSDGDQTVCSDGTLTQTLTATATSDETINWYDASTGGNLVAVPQLVGVGTVTYYAEAFDGTCSSLTRTAVTLTINPAPVVTGGGDQTVCSDGNPNQTLTATATGGTITWYDAASGGNVVSVPELVGVGTVTYYAEASNGLCPSIGRASVTLTINPVPTVTGGGNQTVCYNGNPNQTLTATATGGTITWYDAASGGNVVTSPVQVGIGSVTYYAEASNGLCASLNRAAVVLTINNTPATPGPIAGLTNVCPYINTGDQLTYSIESVPFANTYRWTLPPTVTLVSASPDSTSITVTIGSGFIANVNKVIKVRSISSCGNSAERLLYLLAQFPSTPAPIVASASFVCPSIGTGIPITYTIPKVVAATSYIWSAQNGTTTITHPNGPGVNDTIVTVTFTSGFTTSNITVQSVNNCGTVGTRSLTITRNNPSVPPPISGPTNICQNIAPGGSPASYSIAAVNNADSYNWTVPGGAIGFTGQGTNTISFTYPAGYTNGNISVTATNNCGTSGVRTLAVTSLKPATPGVIDVIQVQPCPNRQYSYTVASMPANAQNIQWTAPTGATIVSGQGSTSIVVSYPNTAFEGNVTAIAYNNCGNSVTRYSPVKLPACPPELPRMTGKTDASAPLDNLDVNVSPNPTTTDFKIQVISAGKEEINVRVLDMQGRLFQQLTVLPYQKINLGAGLKQGTYILEIKQGTKLKTTRLIKF